ncbi:shikimate dehydrogenase family protein [Enterovirga sp. GCM10030262]|uniref:shikimate dehydrogenase family protein n=1 Tax=Enterovirga sp. GCM10030262 TaxID=3273391 RepID=UPI00360EE767
MGRPFAEVIGDPVAHSRSPMIHKAWLADLGIDGDYGAARVTPSQLADYLAGRRADPDWRGCNVTLPHKQAVLPLLDHVDPNARRIGAVNCVYRGAQGLHGCNSDVGGVAAALDCVDLRGGRAALIGAGGAARAALDYLAGREVDRIALLVRDPAKAEDLRSAVAGARVELWPMDRCDGAMSGARLLINASPMGMEGAPAMPPSLLACVAAHAPGTTLFDMVYNPLETGFLAAGRANGAAVVDGLAMLIGQARAAFQLFFGRPPPEDAEARIRALLTT